MLNIQQGLKIPKEKDRAKICLLEGQTKATEQIKNAFGELEEGPHNKV